MKLISYIFSMRRYFNRLLLPVSILLLIQLITSIGVFDRLEMSIYDAWFRLHGSVNPGEQIIVAAIDESSIQEIGPLAWPRSVHSRFLQQLSMAKTVAFDLTFSAPQDEANDQAFAEAIANHGRVVLANKFIFEREEDGELMQIFDPPIPILLSAASGLGFVNTPTDSDQVVRRVNMVDVNTFEGFYFPCFSLAVALLATDSSVTDLKLESDQIRWGTYSIPVNDTFQAFPNFWGPRNTFSTVSYGDIANGSFSPEFFRDKIVLVGYATQEEHDTFATPFTTSNMVVKGSPPVPGVEVHAALVQSILDGIWFKQLPPIYNFAFLCLTILIVSLAVKSRSPLWGFIITLSIVALCMGTVYVIWLNHYWLNLVSPLVAIILTYSGTTAYDLVLTEMSRRKTRAMFSRYVSPAIVEELLENDDMIDLGGNKRVVTIMFADIRGFTAYSENKDPEDVIARLNEYLTKMTECIFKYGGTLDKYLGDGLMAFFGAPIFYDDHVERAIRAAIDMQIEVEKLNDKWEKAGSVPLKVAVGINTGPAVVGNVGSPERMDYTLIGEDVNLASRVEALSKLFTVLIVVSERTYNLITDDELKSSLYYLGAELVKGFTNPIACYSVKNMDLSFEKSTDKGFK